MNELCIVCGAYFPCEHVEEIKDEPRFAKLLEGIWKDEPLPFNETWSDPLTDGDHAGLIIESIDYTNSA